MTNYNIAKEDKNITIDIEKVKKVAEVKEVKKEEIAQSYAKLDQELISALNLAAQRIRAFHLNYKRQSWIDFSEGGLGELVRPLEKIGVYVPGGTACYPSTLLMTVIPAKVAGVKEIMFVPLPRSTATSTPRRWWPRT
jgi:histidinol dehydrogenase